MELQTELCAALGTSLKFSFNPGAWAEIVFLSTLRMTPVAVREDPLGAESETEGQKREGDELARGNQKKLKSAKPPMPARATVRQLGGQLDAAGHYLGGSSRGTAELDCGFLECRLLSVGADGGGYTSLVYQ